MDGAGTWRIFRSITLPLMKPTIVMCLIYCVTGSILAFRPVLHSDQGRSEQFHHDRGAAHLQLRIRFQEGSGMAAALSLIVLAALVVINSIQMRGMRDNTK